jgi:hypothetical protein
LVPDYRDWWQRAVGFSPWHDAVENSSPEEGPLNSGDEPTSVLALRMASTLLL